jgi:hypothetical protein
MPKKKLINVMGREAELDQDYAVQIGFAHLNA